MLHRSKLATCCSALTAAAIGLAPSHAGATTYSGTGWVQLEKSSSNSASTTMAGYDFGIGYTAYFGLEGYNWDVAPDTISVSCVKYLIGGIISVVDSECPNLPGTMISSSTTSEASTYAGMPATKKTTTAIWDVPNMGAMAKVDGYFDLPVTLFDSDLDLFKLTATGYGMTYGDDKVSADVYVLGSKIASASAYLPVTSKRVASYCDTLAEVEGEFTVAGVPITVSASSDGCIYVDASASFSNRLLSGTLTPGASVDATLKVGIGFDADIVSASAGVYGNITVVDASLPVTLSAAVVAGGVTVTESAKLTMTGLDGEAGLYAEGCFLMFCDEATKTIFDWTGMTYASSTIFSASQTINY